MLENSDNQSHFVRCHECRCGSDVERQVALLEQRYAQLQARHSDALNAAVDSRSCRAEPP
jgi:hypothetical protein